MLNDELAELEGEVKVNLGCKSRLQGSVSMFVLLFLLLVKLVVVGMTEVLTDGIDSTTTSFSSISICSANDDSSTTCSCWCRLAEGCSFDRRIVGPPRLVLAREANVDDCGSTPQLFINIFERERETELFENDALTCAMLMHDVVAMASASEFTTGAALPLLFVFLHALNIMRLLAKNNLSK